MSQVIGQSATKLAVTTNGEASYDAQLVLEKLAQVSNLTGATRDKWTLDQTKLFGSLCNNYRSTFAGIYGGRDESGKRKLLPDSVANKLRCEVQTFIVKKMASFLNVKNVTHQTKAFAIDAKTGECFEKVQITGRNIIAELKEQRFGQRLFRNQAQAQLEKLQERFTWGPDEDAKEARLNKYIAERDAWIKILDQGIADEEAKNASKE